MRKIVKAMFAIVVISLFCSFLFGGIVSVFTPLSYKMGVRYSFIFLVAALSLLEIYTLPKTIKVYKIFNEEIGKKRKSSVAAFLVAQRKTGYSNRFLIQCLKKYLEK